MEGLPDSKWEDSLRKSITEMISETRYRHNLPFVAVSDLARQFYCEQKVDLSYVLGDIPTDSKLIGDAVHDQVLAMRATTKNKLISDIKSGKSVIASFLLFGQISGVNIAGMPDAVYFYEGKPKILIELKTTGGSISRLWEDQILQAQLYAYLMEQMGFDISEMRIFIMKIKQDISEKEALLELALFYIKLHKEKELEKVLPVKMFEVKYDKDFVMSKSSWALDYWLLKREPVPAKIASKCRSCEYSKQCKFSLTEKNSS